MLFRSCLPSHSEVLSEIVSQLFGVLSEHQLHSASMHVRTALFSLSSKDPFCSGAFSTANELPAVDVEEMANSSCRQSLTQLLGWLERLLDKVNASSKQEGVALRFEGQTLRFRSVQAVSSLLHSIISTEPSSRSLVDAMV
mgnify:CR=1 FL=1